MKSFIDTILFFNILEEDANLSCIEMATYVMASHGITEKNSLSSHAGKPARPNYNAIHSKPLPVEVHPLPAFIPHNPISAFRIAYVFLSQLILPPTSHPINLHKACFSHRTRSVNVTDPKSIRALWESGFFGKGTLSRSEPTWLERERRRLGISTTETAEEITSRRREERREMKRERARKEREIVEEQLKKEGKVKPAVDGIEVPFSLNNTEDPEYEKHPEPKPMNGSTTSNDAERALLNAGPNLSSMKIEDIANVTQTAHDQIANLEQEGDPIQDQEYLQLSYEEAFFLTCGLGILSIHSEETQKPMSNLELLQLFRQHSYFPTRSLSTLQPDDHFLLSYVVYHHFRSLGWVIREGIKFAVDYLLYNRGPAFSHAEFAVVMIPAYEHPYWFETPERAAETKKKSSQSWWWLHGVNRVQAQVRKTLVLAYVEIPPPSNENGVGIEVQDIGRALKMYKVREFMLKRWTPNRNRD